VDRSCCLFIFLGFGTKSSEKKKIQAPRTTGAVSPGKMTTRNAAYLCTSPFALGACCLRCCYLTAVCLDRPSYGGRTLLTLSTEPHMYAQRGIFPRNQRRAGSEKCGKRNNKRFPKLRLQQQEPASSKEKDMAQSGDRFRRHVLFIVSYRRSEKSLSSDASQSDHIIASSPL